MNSKLILPLLAVSALASVVPTAASAHDNVSLSFGTGYSYPYSGYNEYLDYDDDSYYDNSGYYGDQNDGSGRNAWYQQQLRAQEAQRRWQQQLWYQQHRQRAHQEEEEDEGER